MDNRTVAALSSTELVQSMVRAVQRLFHHVDSATSQQAVGGGKRASGGRKRRRVADGVERPSDSLNNSEWYRWRAHARDEAVEDEEAQQRTAFPVSSFLSSPACPAHFNRFASQPAASASLPRFLACLSSLRDMVQAQRQRISAVSPPLVERLSFTGQSLSALTSQHSTVTSALTLCRERLREAVDDERAVNNNEERYLHVYRSLHRLRSHLRLVSEDERDARDRAALTALSTDKEVTGETVHLASAGVVSCFVIEIKLRRRERGEQERLIEAERRRADAAAAGASLAPPPLHDCVVSVKADFLQGDAELHDTQIDCELYALLSNCRFAALQSKLSHTLSMEAVADRHPHMALYGRKADVAVAFSECRERSKLPCVLLSAVDGPQLAFHHFHTAAAPHDDDRLTLPHLFFSTPPTRLHFASQPGHSFTHSLTYIGMEEMAPLSQASLPPPHSSPSSALSSSPPSRLSYLLSLSPAVVVPFSTLRLLARSAAGESNRSHAHSNHSQPPQSSLSYHDHIARTSQFAHSRLSAHLAVFNTTHHYTLTNDATLIEDACSVSYIPLTVLRALPDIVHTLRQHIAFNQLYASCFRQSHTTRTLTTEADTQPGSEAWKDVVSVELTAFPPHTLRLRIAHPSTAGQFISLDIRVASGDSHEHCTPLAVQTGSPASLASTLTTAAAAASCFDCHIWSVQLDRSFDSVAPCSDSFALRVLSFTQSVPALVHAVVSRAKQQGKTHTTH